MKDKIRVGVIGLGFMGRAHMGSYLRMPGAEIVAVADADPDRRAGRSNIVANIAVPLPPLDVSKYQVYADGRDLIDKADVDLVDICLPTCMHAEFAIRASNAGKHAVVEKPMALNSTLAKEMIATARKNNTKIVVGQCLRFWPEYVYLRETVKNNSLGKLIKAEFFRRAARPTTSWDGWMTDAPRSGGATWDLHVHDVDIVNHIFGAPERLYARAIKTAATGGYDLVTSTYSYPNGLEITIDAAWYMTENFPFRASYLAYFEGGILHFDSFAQPSFLFYKNGAAAPEAIKLSGDAYYNELEFAVNQLLQGKDPEAVVDPESACRSLELVEAEWRSTETGQIITL